MIAIKTDTTGRVTHQHYRPDDIDTEGWTLVESIPARPAVGPTERAVLYMGEEDLEWQVEIIPSITLAASDVPPRPDDAVELVIATDSMTATWQ